MLVCGLGSIGRRHLRHFREAGATRVDAYRTGNATLPDLEQPAPDETFRDLDAALATAPDIVVVANPTAMHLETARRAVDAGCHVLVEKPISHTRSGCDELVELVKERGVVAAVACNLRFHPALIQIRDEVRSGDLGSPIVARAHFGAYLPDWHPWEDFRSSYAARRDLGGGAALTHIHEIDYLLWMFGPARSSVGLSMTAHPLGLDVDEASSCVIQHEAGVLSTVTLSLAQRPPTRTLVISLERATISCDLLSGTWRTTFADGEHQDKSVDAEFDVDQTYRDQTEAFLRAVEGRGSPPVPLASGLAALDVALSMKGPKT